MFPYLDYGLNFKNNELNDFLNFEKHYEITDNIKIGQILPNYYDKINKKRLRQIILDYQNENDYPLFFVFINSNNINEVDLNIIDLFENPIKLTKFKYKILINSSSVDNSKDDVKRDINIEELTKYKIVVVRPDHIVEYLK
jgi:hypothetical protein